MSKSELQKQLIDRESCKYYEYYKEDPTLQENVDPCTFSEILQFSDRYDKIMMAIGCTFALANGVSIIFYANPLKDLINSFDPNSDTKMVLQGVKQAIIGFLLNSILVFINGWFMTTAWMITSQRQVIRARKRFLFSLLNQQMSWHDRNKPEQLCSKLQNYTRQAFNQLISKITNILSRLSLGFGGFILAITTGWQMALVMISFLPIMFVIDKIGDIMNQKWSHRYQKLNIKMNADVIEVFDNIKTVKYLNGEDQEYQRYTKQLLKLSTQARKCKQKQSITWSFYFFGILFNYALGFWYGTKLIADKAINPITGDLYDVGDVISIFFCVYISNLQLSGIFGQLGAVRWGKVNMKRVLNMINRITRQSNGHLDCPHNISSIQFQDVVFAFDSLLFNGLNLSIKKGLVVIMGGSGSGKTTLINMILKFYQPFRGNIVIKSQNESTLINDISTKSLRKNIGYVGQEPVLIGKTLREVLGQNLNDESIWYALQICQADQFVKEIGLDTQFKALSGGQKQRIAIARTILRSPQILILDEGTSALDRINQRYLLINLKNKSRIPFIIMVAHRLETVDYADRVIILDKGAAVVQEKDSKLEFKQLAQFAGKQSLKNEEKSKTQVKQQLDEQQNVKQKQINARKCKIDYFISLLRYNRKYKKHYFIGIIATALFGAIFPLYSFIITNMAMLSSEIKYDDPSKLQQAKDKILTFSIWLFSISVISIFLVILKQVFFARLSESLDYRLKKKAFKSLINRSMEQIDQKGKLNMAYLLNTHCGQLKNGAGYHICSSVEVLSTIISGFTIAFYYCWQITVFALLTIPFSYVANRFQGVFLGKMIKQKDQYQKKSNQMLINYLCNLKTIKSLNYQQTIIAKYNSLLDQQFSKSVKYANLSGISTGFTQSFISLMLSFVYYVGAILVDSYNISIFNFFTAIYAIMFSGVQAGSNVQFVGKLAACANSITEFFIQINPNLNQMEEEYRNQAQSRIIESFQNNLISDKSQIDSNLGQIEFRSVSFCYNNRKQLFRDLNFRILAGEKVAIVGESGSGKTTIADILLKIYKISDGDVLIDGISISFLSKFQISHKIGIVSQQPALFNRSLLKNIKYNTTADFAEVIFATKTANAYEFILKGNFGNQKQTKKHQNITQEDSEDQDMYDLQDGSLKMFKKIVGPKGSYLSGGQKQRVAISRALVRNPKILILDQATSALDNNSESIVHSNLLEKCTQTQIIIAHRLSTIKKCDRILMMKNGRIVQNGRYGDLIKLEGQFYRLINAMKDN